MADDKNRDRKDGKQGEHDQEVLRESVDGFAAWFRGVFVGLFLVGVAVGAYFDGFYGAFGAPVCLVVGGCVGMFVGVAAERVFGDIAKATVRGVVAVGRFVGLLVGGVLGVVAGAFLGTVSGFGLVGALLGAIFGVVLRDYDGTGRNNRATRRTGASSWDWVAGDTVRSTWDEGGDAF